MKKISVLTVAFMLVAFSVYALPAYDVYYEGGPVAYNAAKVIDFDTTGSEMAGMKVTAEYVLNGVEATWVATIDDAGHAVGYHDLIWPFFQKFELGVDGDTFEVNWVLSDLSTGYIKSLTIEALEGNVVFDTKPWDEGESPFNTPGSNKGIEFAITGSSGYPESPGFPLFQGDGYVKATYSDLVALNGKTYGDLYGTLRLDFDPYFGNLLSSASLSFAADTDIVVPVPEPGTLLLLGLGVLGLLGYAKKRK